MTYNVSTFQGKFNTCPPQHLSIPGKGRVKRVLFGHRMTVLKEALVSLEVKCSKIPS